MKWSSPAVALIACFACATPVVAAFSDVAKTHANADAIAYVQAEGIVSGYPDGLFKPDDQINRAEFVKIVTLYKFGQAIIDECGAHNMFSDVAFGVWFEQYVCRARESRIIDGYPDRTFRPNTPINFAEAAKIISISDTLTYGGPSLPPVTGGEWYERYVQYLASLDAIPVSIERLDQYVTRGEMAEMIFRLKTDTQDKPSTTLEELTTNKEPEEKEDAFALPEYGFSIAGVENCAWEDLGPNESQKKIDNGEEISGTIPPARRVFAFDCPSNVAPDFTLSVYKNHNFQASLDGLWDGACGTPSASENLIARYFVPDGKGPSYLEVYQTLIGGGEQADYCFEGKNSTTITMHWTTTGTFGSLEQMERMADSVTSKKK